MGMSHLYNCNANVYFNHQCLRKQLIPTYANYTIAMQMFISIINALENNSHIRQNKSPKYLPRL